MKIAYLVTRANHGGAQVHILELVRPLSKLHDIIVYTGETGYLTAALSASGVAWEQIPQLVHPIAPWKDVSAVRALKKLLMLQAPDLLHSHTAKAGIVGRIAARACGVPSVYTPHGWTFSERSTWPRRVVSWPVEWVCKSLPSWVITVSEWEFRFGKSAGVMKDGRSAVIPHGISDSVHQKISVRDRGPVRIVMVGRFERPKDQLSLVQAFSMLDKRVPVELTLIGDGPAQQEVRNLIRDRNLKSVSLLGSRNDVAELLPTMDILVLASRSECFGLCLVEAMRAGLPVIAAKAGAIPEVVDDGETGLLYEKGDTVQLKRQLQRLVRSADLRARMGRGGRLRYEREFTAERMVRRTEALYKTIVRSPYPADNAGSALEAAEEERILDFLPNRQ